MWRQFTTPEADVLWQQKNQKPEKTKRLVAVGTDYDVTVQDLIKEFNIFSDIPIKDIYGLRAKPHETKTTNSSFINTLHHIFRKPEVIFAVSVNGNTYICDVETRCNPTTFKSPGWYFSVVHPDHLFELIKKQ